MPSEFDQFVLKVAFHQLVDYVNCDCEDSYPPQEPEGIPENQGYQNRQEYEHKVLFAAHCRLEQAEFPPLHRRA